MQNYRQSNGLFHETLPEFHHLSPHSKAALTAENAGQYGYEPAENYPHEYGVWLVESGVYITKINNAYIAAVASMVKDTPDFERESWPKQEAEAKAYNADGNALTPYVDTLAASRGIPRALLLTKILEKVALYEAAHAYLTGLRQAKEDAIYALDIAVVTHEDVLAISVDFMIPETA